MKTSFMLLIFLMIGQLANAQIEAGARLGLNFSNQKWQLGLDDQSDDMKTGLSAGGYANVKIAKSFSVQPELLYSAMGSKASEGNYQLAYISLPVFLRYDYNDLLEIHLGPQVSYLMSGKYDNIDIKNSYKEFDLGAIIGVGVKIEAFEGGVRYYRGFSNTFAENEADIKLTQSAFQVFAGYRIFSK